MEEQCGMDVWSRLDPKDFCNMTSLTSIGDLQQSLTVHPISQLVLYTEELECCTGLLEYSSTCMELILKSQRRIVNRKKEYTGSTSTPFPTSFSMCTVFNFSRCCHFSFCLRSWLLRAFQFWERFWKHLLHNGKWSWQWSPCGQQNLSNNLTK